MAEDKRQTLDIPLGTTFEFKDGKLVFGHESDIVIRTNMGGYRFQKIFSKRGNVQVLPPEGVEFDVEEIDAPNGDVFFNGRVKAKLTRARTVHFQEGQLTAEVIEAKDEVVEASAGGGMVKVKVSGDLRLLEVAIDPEAIDPEDAELLQDMVLAAVNEGIRAAQELAESKLGGVAGGLGGPGGLGGLGLPGM